MYFSGIENVYFPQFPPSRKFHVYRLDYDHKKWEFSRNFNNGKKNIFEYSQKIPIPI